MDEMILELDVVKTRHAVEGAGTSVPHGRQGIVVHLYEAPDVFEVDFSDPQAVVTCRADDLDLVWAAPPTLPGRDPGPGVPRREVFERISRAADARRRIAELTADPEGPYHPLVASIWELVEPDRITPRGPALDAALDLADAVAPGWSPTLTCSEGRGAKALLVRPSADGEDGREREGPHWKVRGASPLEGRHGMALAILDACLERIAHGARLDLAPRRCDLREAAYQAICKIDAGIGDDRLGRVLRPIARHMGRDPVLAAFADALIGPEAAAMTREAKATAISELAEVSGGYEGARVVGRRLQDALGATEATR